MLKHFLLPKQHQNNIEKVQKTTFLSRKIVKTRLSTQQKSLLFKLDLKAVILLCWYQKLMEKSSPLIAIAKNIKKVTILHKKKLSENFSKIKNTPLRATAATARDHQIKFTVRRSVKNSKIIQKRATQTKGTLTVSYKELSFSE